MTINVNKKKSSSRSYIFHCASHSWKYWCFHYTRWQYLWYSQQKSNYPLCINVTSTSTFLRRCIDVFATFYKRHVPSRTYLKLRLLDFSTLDIFLTKVIVNLLYGAQRAERVLMSYANHYENKLIKFSENFTTKKWTFSDKYFHVFHISTQNIDCGFSLEPPRRGGSNEYHNLCFREEIRT